MVGWISRPTGKAIHLGPSVARSRIASPDAQEEGVCWAPGVSWSHCRLWQAQGGESSGSLPLASLLPTHSFSLLRFSLLWSLAFPRSRKPHSMAFSR